jgi:hypothetical protein
MYVTDGLSIDDRWIWQRDCCNNPMLSKKIWHGKILQSIYFTILVIFINQRKDNDKITNIQFIITAMWIQVHYPEKFINQKNRRCYETQQITEHVCINNYLPTGGNTRKRINLIQGSFTYLTCCFCCRNCRSISAIFSLWVSLSRRREASWFSLSFSRNSFSWTQHQFSLLWYILLNNQT